MTAAEIIAARLGNDGQQGEDAAGTDLATLARRAGARVSMRGDLVRYSFPDGSAIVASAGGWDIAFAECWCWVSAGHLDTCPKGRGSAS